MVALRSCPSGHPLAALDSPTLEQIAHYPLITYTDGFTGRFRIDEGFEARGLTPNYVVTAADADVIKTYVRKGMGVGIISTMAYEEQSDGDLIKIGSPNYFASLLSCIAFRRGTFLRGFMYGLSSSSRRTSLKTLSNTRCLLRTQRSAMSFAQDSKFHAFRRCTA